MAAMSSAAPAEPNLPALSAVPVAAPDWRAPLLTIWLAWMLVCLGIGVADFVLLKRLTIADLFFFQQDVPVMIATTVFLVLLRFAPLHLAPAWSAPAALAARSGWIAAGFAAAVAGAGWFAVCHAYPYAMDEFLVGFDGAGFRHGAMTAPIPEAWRPYAFALQPQYVIRSAAGDAWSSLYLPLNALFRAGLDMVGAAWAAGAMWTAVGIGATYGVARRLWPERQDAAALAALLLATSSQVLVTAMTPYAQSAHLALNMVWLWLFLRPDRLSQVAAVVVGFAIYGLHQVLFFPLFAAPFVLGLWLQRRWGLASFHTLSYAVMGLFWLSYWTFVLPGGGVEGAAHAESHLGAGFIAQRAAGMLAKLDPGTIGLMARNLFRFAAWQNPLLPVLAVIGMTAAIRARGPLLCLAAGIGLTLAVFAVLLPFQGHGWGYRYLHGLLGGAALLAAFAWMRLTDPMQPSDRRAAHTVLAASAVFSLAVLLPIRAWQVEAMIRPYATAANAIRHTDAEVVLVDPTGLFYAEDLVRNDPLLRNSPKVMDLGVLTEGQIRTLCGSGRTAVFGMAEGLAAGMSVSPGGPPPKLAAARKLVADLGCGKAPAQSAAAAGLRPRLSPSAS